MLAYFLREHGLSVGLGAIVVAFGVWSRILEQGTWLYDIVQGFCHDTWGAFLIVLATKWLRERGSAQSR